MKEITDRNLSQIAKNLLDTGHFTIPNVKGWALAYVYAERPIPEKFRSEFLDELCSDDVEYKTCLEDNLKRFGVRWAKEEIS